MSYLLGDSTDAGLEFNYLDFTREVVECAVVLVEAELELGRTIETRRERQTESAAIIKSVEELGQRASAIVTPVAKDQAGAPVGRCATAIAAAVKDTVDREIASARAVLAADLDELDRADRKVRARNRDVLEKLLRAHDLPEAEKTYEVVWSNTVQASVRERTTFGVEAVLALDLAANTLFTPDLRVDRLVEGVEIHAVEAGGWLKKGDKVVPHKLGRYFITRVALQPEVTFRLNATHEPSSLGFTITVRGDEALLVERHGDGMKEFQIEDEDKPKLCQLAARLAKEVRDLDGSRGALRSIDVGGKPVAEHAHPRELAELLIETIAPTVRKIAKHSRSSDELVLRRALGGNRREELFMPTRDLLKLFEHLPETGREVFAPLELDGKPYVAKPKPKPPAPTKPPVPVKLPATLVEDEESPPPAAKAAAGPPAAVAAPTDEAWQDPEREAP